MAIARTIYPSFLNEGSRDELELAPLCLIDPKCHENRDYRSRECLCHRDYALTLVLCYVTTRVGCIHDSSNPSSLRE